MTASNNQPSYMFFFSAELTAIGKSADELNRSIGLCELQVACKNWILM